MDALSLIVEAFEPLAGRHILDLGCGAGALAKALAERGAAVTGVDPGEAAIAEARRFVPNARFLQVSADAVPLPDASADGAVFLNSLHHLPEPSAALREAKRLLRGGSRVVVIEPLADGSFFEVLRLIEDETDVRRAAQAAVAAAIAGGVLLCEREVTFDRVERFASFDGFLARVAAVDPARSAAIAGKRNAIKACFDRSAVVDDTGRHGLCQPLRVQVLRTPG